MGAGPQCERLPPCRHATGRGFDPPEVSGSVGHVMCAAMDSWESRKKYLYLRWQFVAESGLSAAACRGTEPLCGASDWRRPLCAVPNYESRGRWRPPRGRSGAPKACIVAGLVGGARAAGCREWRQQIMMSALATLASLASRGVSQASAATVGVPSKHDLGTP